MKVSVTPLGDTASSVIGTAGRIVEYLEDGRAKLDGGQRPGFVHEVPSPSGGTVAYYADSSGVRPGKWVLGHRTGDVDASELHALLAGCDPVTGERFRYSETRPDTGVSPEGDTIRAGERESFTTEQAAAVLQVSTRRVQQLCRAALRVGGPESAGLSRGPKRSWIMSAELVACFADERNTARQVLAYDLTFSVPKSVSDLWAASQDEQTRAAVLTSVEEAVAAGLRYAEDEAIKIRAVVKGPDGPGELRVLDAGDPAAASYLHTTSRALDPQLHVHVVLLNYAKGPDGGRRALDGRQLFLHAKTMAHLSAAELRHQLTARLGVTWTTVVNGVAEIAGVPKAAMTATSTRSSQIKAELARLGVDGAAARQVAAYQTRRAKVHGVDMDALFARWRQLLAGAGLDEEAVAGIVNQVQAPGLLTEEMLQSHFTHLLRPSGITALSATIDRRDVVQSFADFAGDRLSGEAITQLADRFLALPAMVRLDATLDRGANHVIRRGDGQVVVVPPNTLYTTTAMIALEERVRSAYEAGLAANRGAVPADVVEAVLAEERFAALSNEQREFVRGLTTSGAMILGAEGLAGTGKTTALAAAVAAWEAAGSRVLGAAVGGTQALLLGDEAGIEAKTVASILYRFVTMNELGMIDDATVIVVDEASMLSTFDLAGLVALAEQSGAVLRLVGDSHQHGPVAAGGIYRWIVAHTEATPRLTTIYRQQGPEMAEVREALAEFRAGNFDACLDRLTADGRVLECSTPEEAHDHLVRAWYAEHVRRSADPERRTSAMTAMTHFERRALNARARALLREDGSLEGPDLVIDEDAGLAFARGDQVIAKAADFTLRGEGGDPDAWVRNGSLGTVAEVLADERALVVDFHRFGRIEVPESYLCREIAPGVRGGLQHAYAATTYTAQGQTHAVGLAELTDSGSREATYVALTRAQLSLTVALIRRSDLTQSLTDDLLPALAQDRTAYESFVRSLESARVERLATEVDSEAGVVHRLARTLALPELVEAMGRADLVEAMGRAGPEVGLYDRAISERIDRIVRFAIANPPRDVLEHFGPRPLDRGHRVVWDNAVTALTVYREREAIDPVQDASAVGWAIGPPPQQQPQRQPQSGSALDDYELVAEHVRAAGALRTGSTAPPGDVEERDQATESPDTITAPVLPAYALHPGMAVGVPGVPGPYASLSDEELADSLGRALHNLEEAEGDVSFYRQYVATTVGTVDAAVAAEGEARPEVTGALAVASDQLARAEGTWRVALEEFQELDGELSRRVVDAQPEESSGPGSRDPYGANPYGQPTEPSGARRGRAPRR